MNLAIPILPRLSQHWNSWRHIVYEFDLTPDIYDWFGFDVSCEHPDSIGLVRVSKNRPLSTLI